MYRNIGKSESKGETSPWSDLKGAPNRSSAVGEFNSVISNLTCWEISSRLRSAMVISNDATAVIFRHTMFLFPSQSLI
jgi:hypothetical protein